MWIILLAPRLSARTVKFILAILQRNESTKTPTCPGNGAPSIWPDTVNLKFNYEWCWILVSRVSVHWIVMVYPVFRKWCPICGTLYVVSFLFVVNTAGCSVIFFGFNDDVSTYPLYFLVKLINTQ
jgi:hypothetical protein